MKKTTKISMILTLALPLLFIGCKKSELTDNTTNTGLSDNNQVKTTLEYCGTPITASMVEFNNSTSYGTVTVGNDATTLQIKYELTNPNWYINLPQLFVGTLEEFDALPGTTINPDGTLYINENPPNLPINPGYTDGGSYWEYNIDLSTLPDCFIVVAYAGLRDISGTGPRLDVFGKTMLKTPGYYLNYCVQECPPPTPVISCETGYAYGENYANCFLNIQGVTSNNWGWSNGPIGPGDYSWPIYAGAGQCNTDNGTLVGTLDVSYTIEGTATVTYNFLPGYTTTVTHLYVGSEILPRDKKGKFTTAPGQFPYRHTNLPGVSTDSYTITGLSGLIYIAAHAEVCGEY